jgi:hypothetical protein
VRLKDEHGEFQVASAECLSGYPSGCCGYQVR